MVYKSSKLVTGGSDGTVTDINTGTGLTGGPITTSGTISVADSAPNSLAGYDNTGEFSTVTVSTGLSLSAGVLTATGGSGTVTSVAINGANGIGVSGSPITTSGTIDLSLVNITPTTVNALTLAAQAVGFTLAGGTTSKTLTVPLDATVSGTNTGDQSLFSKVSVSGQSDVTANTTTTDLTFVASTNMTITTDNTAKTVTFAASGGGGGGDVSGPASSTDNAIARFDSTTGKIIQNSAVTVADTTGVIAGTQGITFTGSSSGTTALVPTAAASGTLTLPAATDTLTGKATTDTLTNKTYDTAGSGNAFKINGTDITAVTGSGAVALATSPTFVTPTLGSASASNVTMATAGALRTSTSDTNTLLLQAYDVDGTAYTTFATLTAGNTPTMALDGAVTGATQSQGNNSTKLATTAYVDTGLATKTSSTLTNTHILVGNGSNVATDVAMSGDISIANTGATTVAKIAGTTVSGTTGTTNSVFSNSPTLVTPVLGVASATSLATSAASPLLLTNGQLTTISLTSQTVGGVTLTIPDFASVNDEFTFKTKSQTLSNKTFVAPALGTPASGVATNLTGTASGLTAGNVTTNANLTGVITSSGNATSIGSQTGTGTKFVVDTSPTLVTPTIGVATATSVNKVAITAPATSATLTLADGSTLATSGGNSITLTSTGSTTVTLPTAGTLATNSQIFDFCGFVETPSNKIYTFAYNLDFGGTINATKTICSSGTATATFKINTTALGGAANSVSSSGDSITQSSANAFVSGDKLTVTISSNSSCADFAFTVKFTRTIA